MTDPAHNIFIKKQKKLKEKINKNKSKFDQSTLCAHVSFMLAGMPFIRSSKGYVK